MGKFAVCSLVFFWVAPALAASSFTLEQLRQILDDRKASQIEAVIPHLPATFLSSHTYLKAPLGRQKGSPKLPRALMFQPPQGTAQPEILAIAFNGDPKAEGYNSLEVMEYVPKPARGASSIRLYDWEFPPKRDSAGKALIPTANPSQCTGCHGPRPKPFWGTYPHWDQAFGGKDDSFNLPEGEEYDFLGTAAEAKQLQEFLNGEKKKGRYLALTPPPGSENSPYLPSGFYYYKGDLTFRPNARLNEILLRIHSRTVFLRLQESAFYSKYRSAFIFMATGCAWEKNFQSAFPDAKNAEHALESVRQALNADWEKIHSPFRLSRADLVDSATRKLPRRYGKNDQMLLPLFGLEPDDMNLNFDLDLTKNPSTYLDGGAHTEDYVADFALRAFLQDHPSLNHLYDPFTDVKLYESELKNEDRFRSYRDRDFAVAVDRLANKVNILGGEPPLKNDETRDYEDANKSSRLCAALALGMEEELNN